MTNRIVHFTPANTLIECARIARDEGLILYTDGNQTIAANFRPEGFHALGVHSRAFDHETDDSAA